MAQRVRTQELEFKHAPLSMGHEGMIRGDVNFSRVHFMDDFLVDTLNGDNWAESVGNGGVAAAIVAGANGLVALAVNTVDNDCAEEYGPAVWYGQQECVIECRLKVNAITEVAFNMGFVNAASATNDMIAYMVSGTTVSDGTNVTDGAAFCFDTDATTDRYYICGTKDTNSVQGILAAAGFVPVANTFEVLKIMIDSAGNAHFFRNGVTVGSVIAALTPTVALRPYFALKNNNNTGRTLTVDYVRCSQNRLESSSVVR